MQKGVKKQKAQKAQKTQGFALRLFCVDLITALDSCDTFGPQAQQSSKFA
jgi:hypothetical protein